MSFFQVFVILVVIVSVTFFLLGLKSQKGSAPGMVDGRLKPCGAKPNCVSSEEGTQPEKKVKPIEATFEQVKQAIVATGGTITSETSDYGSATYMSKVYKFVDDVEIRDAGDGVIHIRSGSRVGYSDRGVNRKRVNLIRQAIAE